MITRNIHKQNTFIRKKNLHQLYTRYGAHILKYDHHPRGVIR